MHTAIGFSYYDAGRRRRRGLVFTTLRRGIPRWLGSFRRMQASDLSGNLEKPGFEVSKVKAVNLDYGIDYCAFRLLKLRPA